MQNNFYLHESSFICSSIMTNIELGSLIEELSSTCSDIRLNEDIVYKNDVIYSIEIFQNKQIYEIIWNPEDNTFTDNQKKALMLIIDHSTSISETYLEIIEKLNNHDIKEIWGIICLIKIDVLNVNREQLVYNFNDWLNFHRYFMGIYPISEKHFFKECKISFPDIFFHNNIENTLSTLDGSIFNFCKTIVKALCFLNDNFKKYYDETNVQHSLKLCSSAFGFEISLEGNAHRKKDLTFDFVDKNKKPKSICCDPHIKLCTSDNIGDNHYYYNRIYFYGGHIDIEENKVLIGYIGKHL